MNVGDVTVAVMIGEMKFAEGIVMRRTLDAGVVDADFLGGLDIVVNNHPAGADKGHLANLAGLEPTTLDCGEALVWKTKRHVSHILDAGSYMGITLAIDHGGKLAEDVKDD